MSGARTEMVRELVSAAAPDQRAAFESAVAGLHGPAGARAVERIADALTARFLQQDVDGVAVLRSVAANIGRIAEAGPGAAEQATMTFDALSGRGEASKALYDYLEHPSAYRPGEFVVLFRRAMQ